MKQINKFFILFLIIILLSQNVLAQKASIPWDEVRALYGDTVAQNARRMVEEQGISPLFIRELDKWTGAIHFEYKLPSNIPTGNVNIWVYDPTMNTVTWSGPGPAPYSPEEALQKIQQYNSSGPQNPFTPQPSGTTQQISLLANNQTNLTVYVGNTINYIWKAPTGYIYSSTYTADAPDNCPGGIMQQGEIKPWVANTEQGSNSAVVQQCQAGRTYNITYMAKDSSQKVVYQSSVVVKVAAGLKPTTQYNPLDTSIYTGPTTIPGVTDKNQKIQVQTQIQNQNQTGLNQNSLINSLSDTISKINSILEGAKNLSQEDQDIISKAIQTVLGTLQNLITSLTLKNSQNQSQIPETSSAQKVSTSIPGVKISVTLKPSTTTFRYIKDDISKSGWVAIREMKFYDANNNEIKPVNANASCDWCGYGTPPFYSVGPKGVFDGNWETVWNAGETAENCSWYVPHLRDDGIYGVGCSASKIRKAWINVDLGAPVSLSKIKIHVMGDSNNRLDSLSGSIDGENYIDLCKIQASKDMPLVDLGPKGDWIECNLEK